MLGRELARSKPDLIATHKLPPWREPESLGAAKKAIWNLGRTMHEYAYLLGKELAWVKEKVGLGTF